MKGKRDVDARKINECLVKCQREVYSIFQGSSLTKFTPHLQLLIPTYENFANLMCPTCLLKIYMKYAPSLSLPLITITLSYQLGQSCFEEYKNVTQVELQLKK